MATPVPAETTELPLFPLNTVLFPGGLLPLRIFEIRYLDMISRCLRHDSGFVVCLAPQEQHEGESSELAHVGTVARIIDWERLQDGLLGIMVQGEQRVHIQQTREQKDRLLLGQVHFLEEPPDVALPEEFISLAELLERILSTLGGHYAQIERHGQQASWVAARLTEILPIPPLEKQRILENNDPLARLFYLRDAMMHTYA